MNGVQSCSFFESESCVCRSRLEILPGSLQREDVWTHTVMGACGDITTAHNSEPRSQLPTHRGKQVHETYR